jgi:hypothetical protein
MRCTLNRCGGGCLPAGTKCGLDRRWALIVAGLVATAYSACVPAAGFIFDWAPDNPSQTFNGTSVTHGDVGIGGQTPFLYERVTDPNGVEYYHMIIGAPSSGFGEEIYIKLTAPFTGYGSLGDVGGPSDSGGTFGAPGNGLDPLGAVTPNVATGNTSGNPNSVQLDMIVNDGEISMEFLKDKFDHKPVITQMLNAPDITSAVMIDMRNSTYSDMNTPGVMLNTMSLQGPNVPPGQGQFDMSKDGQNINVTAGRYTYSSGTYTYMDGGFNSGSVNWGDFFDPTESNPWAYPDNHP